jgi:hypothetical protein
MEKHIDHNIPSQEENQLPEHLEAHEKDRLTHLHRSKNLMQYNQISEALKQKPYFKALMIRCLFLILAISAFSGQVQHVTNRVMGPVWDYDQAYLEKTLLNLGGSLFVLSVPKGLVETAASAELEPSGAGFKVGAIKAGEILEPFSNIIDDIWDFLVLSTYLVIGQLAALKLINLLAIKFFLGLGALSCAIQYRRHTFFGKLGLTLLLLFVLTYAFYPLSLNMAAKTYESHQIETSTRLSENLGILKEQASDIELLSLKNFSENMKQIPKILGQGVRTSWDAAMDLIIGLVLMFVLLPLLVLGSIYLIAKRAMNYLDMPRVSSRLENDTQKLVNQMGSRTRMSLSTP